MKLLRCTTCSAAYVVEDDVMWQDEPPTCRAAYLDPGAPVRVEACHGTLDTVGPLDLTGWLAQLLRKIR